MRRTKANPAALVAFGALGLASRRAFPLITITTDPEDVYLRTGGRAGPRIGVEWPTYLVGLASRPSRPTQTAMA